MPSQKYTILFVVILIGIQAVSLFTMGQPIICTCGYIKLWEGVVLSSDNSQHLSDWYSFSHLIHGFIFYFATWLFLPRLPISVRFLMALGIEVSWEVFENTPWLIEHYRQQALASGYVGDSIINSLSDSFVMIIGFWIAWRLPWWMTLLIGLALEIWVGYSIRDNLTLNILNFIYAIPAIKNWQAHVG